MKYLERINRRTIKNLKIERSVISLKDLGKKLGVKIVGISPIGEDKIEFLIEVKTNKFKKEV